MVSHLRTPILKGFYLLLWFYFVTDSEFRCSAELAKSYPVSALTYLPQIPNGHHCIPKGAHEVLQTISEARCLQAAVEATTPQFVRSGSAPSVLRCLICSNPVVASSGGPCSSASWPCPCGRAGCWRFCAPRCSRCVSYESCRRCSGAARRRKRSWCR